MQNKIHGPGPTTVVPEAKDTLEIPGELGNNAYAWPDPRPTESESLGVGLKLDGQIKKQDTQLHVNFRYTTNNFCIHKILNTYGVPSTVPGAGHTAEDKAAETPTLRVFKF